MLRGTGSREAGENRDHATFPEQLGWQVLCLGSPSGRLPMFPTAGNGFERPLQTSRDEWEMRFRQLVGAYRASLFR